MRIVAIFSLYNEERFIPYTLEHLRAQGVESYIVDNESTDRTRSIVERYHGRGVIGIETLPRQGVFELRKILRRVEQLHQELGADWYLHHDADQFRYAPNPFGTLAEGIQAMDQQGYNAINFDVFDFMPTAVEEDFEEERFLQEMEYYYYFRPRPKHQLKCWKNFGQPIALLETGGHCVGFQGRSIAPIAFIQRHYIAISRQQLIEKYCQRKFSAAELRDGWHGSRALLRPEDFRFPARALLKKLTPDNTWDTSDPWTTRYVFSGVDRASRQGELEILMNRSVPA